MFSRGSNNLDSLSGLMLVKWGEVEVVGMILKLRCCLLELLCRIYPDIGPWAGF